MINSKFFIDSLSEKINAVKARIEELEKLKEILKDLEKIRLHYETINEVQKEDSVEEEKIKGEAFIDHTIATLYTYKRNSDE